MAADAETYKAAGNKALQAGNYDEAIESYTKAIEVSEGVAGAPRHVYFSNRSAAFLSKGDASSALDDAEKCIESNSTWPKGFSRKGAALHAMRRYDEATTAYEAGLKLAPSDAALLSGLEDVKKASDAANRPPPPKSNPLAQIFAPQNLVKIAGHPVYSRYLAEPDFMQKIQLLQTDPTALQTVFQDGRIMNVFSFLSGLDLRAGGAGAGGEGGGQEEDNYSPPPAPSAEQKAQQKEEATSSAQPSQEETPESELSDKEKELKKRKIEALNAKERGNKHYSMKEFPEALAAYDEAISTDPSNMSFRTNKAAVFFEQGDYDKVLSECEEAIQVGRANRAPYADVAKAYIRMGKSYLKKDDYGAAIQAFRQAQVEHYSKDVERMIRSTETEKKKREEAAYIDPPKAVEAKDRGNDFFRAGSWPDAVMEYDEAIKRDPTNASYRNNLAAALSKLMDFPAAKEACEKAIELDPQYVKAWAKKGDIEFFMKEYHKAMESYKRGLEIEPNNSLCMQGLQKTASKIREASSQEVDMERAAHGMADPEIQAILQDPIIRQVLTDINENPVAGRKALQDPIVASKIEKLIAAGVLRTG